MAYDGLCVLGSGLGNFDSHEDVEQRTFPLLLPHLQEPEAPDMARFCNITGKTHLRHDVAIKNNDMNS